MTTDRLVRNEYLNGGVEKESEGTKSLKNLLGIYNKMQNEVEVKQEPFKTKMERCNPKPKRPRKTSKETDSKESESEEPKRKRFVWNDELHRRFMAAIFDIGLRQAKPKLIYNLMEPTVPDDLTTEHIKSHLQKYRVNSKATKEKFLEQFDISKSQVERQKVGKAINPGFHAYPMPIGDYPLEKKIADTAAPPAFKVSTSPHSISSRGVVITPRAEPVSEAAPLENLPHEIASNQKPIVFDQMEMQMKIHRHIQEQHALQQNVHTRIAPDSSNGIEAAEFDTFSDPSALFNSSPFISFQQGKAPAPFSLDDPNDNLNDLEEDLFDFLQ